MWLLEELRRGKCVGRSWSPVGARATARRRAVVADGEEVREEKKRKVVASGGVKETERRAALTKGRELRVVDARRETGGERSDLEQKVEKEAEDDGDLDWGEVRRCSNEGKSHLGSGAGRPTGRRSRRSTRVQLVAVGGLAPWWSASGGEGGADGELGLRSREEARGKGCWLEQGIWVAHGCGGDTGRGELGRFRDSP